MFRSHTEQQHVLWALSPLHSKLIGRAVSLSWRSVVKSQDSASLLQDTENTQQSSLIKLPEMLLTH